MNRVIFDLLHAQPIGESKFHGGGEYIKSVFSAMSEQYAQKYILEVVYNKNTFIDEWILESIDKNNIIVHHVKNVEDVVALLEDMNDDIETYFFTGMIYGYWNKKLPNNIKKIGVCHGVRGLEKPYDVEAWRYIKTKQDIKEFILEVLLKKRTINKRKRNFIDLLRQFDLIITDSKHSEHSIKINFPEIVNVIDLKVLYAPPKRVEMVEVVESKQPYIMMINANRWLKNSYRGIQALDELYTAGYLKDVKTKVYGNYPKKLRKKIKKIEMFEFFDYVSQNELEIAYASCSVFFYPTLNEGFGLPPMEAMKYGKTCVISGVCSLPELYADAVYYCNPYDIMEMKNRLLRAVSEKIPEDKMQECLERIHKKQEQDLEMLCRLIVEK